MMPKMITSGNKRGHLVPRGRGRRQLTAGEKHNFFELELWQLLVPSGRHFRPATGTGRVRRSRAVDKRRPFRDPGSVQ